MALRWPPQRTLATALVAPCGGVAAAGAVSELPSEPLVTVPILVAGAFALAVATSRLMSLARTRIAAPPEIEACTAALAAGDRAAAFARARAVPGPVGELLVVGLQRLDEPPERIAARLAAHREWTQRGLQARSTLVAWAAAVAPLLALLGVLIGFAHVVAFTVFDIGSSDSLAAGRASAFTSMQYGLAAALPAWLVYVLLAQRVRRLLGALDAATAMLLASVRAMPKSDAGRGTPPARQ